MKYQYNSYKLFESFFDDIDDVEIEDTKSQLDSIDEDTVIEDFEHSGFNFYIDITQNMYSHKPTRQEEIQFDYPANNIYHTCTYIKKIFDNLFPSISEYHIQQRLNIVEYGQENGQCRYFKPTKQKCYCCDVYEHEEALRLTKSHENVNFNLHVIILFNTAPKSFKIFSNDILNLQTQIYSVYKLKLRGSEISIRSTKNENAFNFELNAKNILPEVMSNMYQELIAEPYKIQFDTETGNDILYHNIMVKMKWPEIISKYVANSNLAIANYSYYIQPYRSSINKKAPMFVIDVAYQYSDELNKSSVLDDIVDNMLDVTDSKLNYLTDKFQVVFIARLHNKGGFIQTAQQKSVYSYSTYNHNRYSAHRRSGKQNFTTVFDLKSKNSNGIYGYSVNFAVAFVNNSNRVTTTSNKLDLKEYLWIFNPDNKDFV